MSAGSLFFGDSATQWHLTHEVQQLAGTQVAIVVEALVKQARKPAEGTLESLVELGTLMIGASGIFAELRSALNTMWDIHPPQTSGFLQVVRERLLAVVMVLAIGLLLIASVLVSAVLAAVGRLFEGRVAIPVGALEFSNFAFSFVALTLLFALVLRFVPEAKLPPRDIWVGAVVNAFIFTIGKSLIGLYLGRASISSLYGTGGSTIVVLIWVYYSAQLFLFGAEFTRVQGQYRRAS
jgi:membrane protein